MIKTIPFSNTSDKDLLDFFKKYYDESYQKILTKEVNDQVTESDIDLQITKELKETYNARVIEEGVILSPDVNFNHKIDLKTTNGTFEKPEIGEYNEYPGDYSNSELPISYGVCDNYEQIIEKYKILTTSESLFSIVITPMIKNEQPESGGWRWHKWGSYIGEHEITSEYLYDEEDIEKVYVFHIYEFKI